MSLGLIDRKSAVKLTDKVGKGKGSGAKLTLQNQRKFILSFEYPLSKRYDFEKLEKSDIRIFQRFLNKVSDMTFSQVDNSYKRDNDSGDTYEGMQVVHDEAAKTFRVHGVIEDGRFKVLRLDKSHKVHNKKRARY